MDHRSPYSVSSHYRPAPPPGHPPAPAGAPLPYGGYPAVGVTEAMAPASPQSRQVLVVGGSMLALAALVGVGGGLVPTLVTPPVAQAYTSRVNLLIVREPGESFETLVQRSEIIARAAIQRSFDADVLMTDVIVTVTGDNQGIAIPILMVPVSRSDWRLSPDVAQWARYFEAARALAVD